MLKLNKLFEKNEDEQMKSSEEIVDQVNMSERLDPAPPEESLANVSDVEEPLFQSKYYEMAQNVLKNYDDFANYSYYDPKDFFIKAEKLALFLKEKKAIPIAKEKFKEGDMKSIVVFVDDSHGKEYKKDGRSTWICNRCSKAHVYFEENVYCETENHLCEPIETSPKPHSTPKLIAKRGTSRPQSANAALSHSKNTSRDSLNPSTSKNRDSNAFAASLPSRPTPLSSKPHQSKMPSNTAAKQRKSRAKKRSKPSANVTAADRFPFVPYAPRTKSIDSDIFECTSTMSQPIRHPDDSDIESMYGKRAKRTSSLPRMEHHQSKAPQAETPAMEETLSAEPVLSPFFVPSAGALKDACKELKLEFNFAAYQYWSIMKISSIPSKVVSFEIYPIEHIDGFKLLSMLLTSSDNLDDSTHLAMNVNKKIYYHYKKYPEDEPNEDPGEFLFCGKLTIHHLKFLSQLLSCRIGIYAEDGTLNKYGLWDNDEDVMTILLSVKDENYALVTKVHG